MIGSLNNHPLPKARVEEAGHLRGTIVDEEIQAMSLSPAASPRDIGSKTCEAQGIRSTVLAFVFHPFIELPILGYRGPAEWIARVAGYALDPITRQYRLDMTHMQTKLTSMVRSPYASSAVGLSGDLGPLPHATDARKLMDDLLQYSQRTLMPRAASS